MEDSLRQEDEYKQALESGEPAKKPKAIKVLGMSGDEALEFMAETGNS